MPRGAERDRRLASVLEVVYLIFNEGYAATAGDDLIRPGLCAEARRLGRILARPRPDEPEVFGLLALMELQSSRLAARTGPDGALVPLPEQNRARWDRLLIARGLAALDRAEALGGADGPYALQAALAACHARAARAADTDWPRIAGLYDRLRAVMPSPVVELNRAVAHGMAFGPEAGLSLLAAIEPSALPRYAPLPAARADLLLRSGRQDEARAEFERAAGAEPERTRARASSLRAPPPAALDMWRRSGCAVAATAVRSDVPISGVRKFFFRGAGAGPPKGVWCRIRDETSSAARATRSPGYENGRREAARDARLARNEESDA